MICDFHRADKPQGGKWKMSGERGAGSGERRVKWKIPNNNKV